MIGSATVRRQLQALAKATAIGALGGACFAALGLPLAWMLGSLFAVVVAGRVAPPVSMPRVARDTLVPVIGVLLGSAFTPQLIAQLPQWPLALGAVVLYGIVLASLGRLYFRRVAGFDATTAFFASLPGGLSDITLVGADRGADLGRLALVHIARVVAVVSLLPFVLLVMHVTPNGAAVTQPGAGVPFDLAHIALLAGLAVAGSWVGKRLHMPASAIIGPMVLSALLHLTGLAVVVPPRWLVIVAQIVLGAYIGSRMSGTHARVMGGAMLHGLIWAVLMIATAVGVAALAAPVTGLPFGVILLGLAPGGLAEMAVLALAFGIDVAFVATAHLLRLVVVYALVAVTLARR